MTGTTDPRMPRVGDVLGEYQEPPRVEGLLLVDKDNDLIEWDEERGGWRRGLGRGLRWVEDIYPYAPITVRAVPSGPVPGGEWPEVQSRDLRPGDEIEVTYPAGEHAAAVVRGVITVTGIGMVYLRDEIEVPLAGTTIRRRPMLPEPGPGALWEAGRQRYYNTGARPSSDPEGPYIWTTPQDPYGSYDWDEIRTYPNLHELVAAPGERS